MVGGLNWRGAGYRGQLEVYTSAFPGRRHISATCHLAQDQLCSFLYVVRSFMINETIYGFRQLKSYYFTLEYDNCLYLSVASKCRIEIPIIPLAFEV